MNLPNKLTVARILMVPVFVAVAMLSGVIASPLWNILCIVLFALASLTDMLDGKIARKYNLITDFGKFLDPLADKFMVIAAFLVILYQFEDLRWIFIYAVMIVIFRELAVTSIRLVASSTGGVVIAANMLGKIKTVSQIVCVVTIFAEPLFAMIPGAETFFGYHPLSYLTTAVMSVFTLWSGINYIVGGWKYLDPQK